MNCLADTGKSAAQCASIFCRGGKRKTRKNRNRRKPQKGCKSRKQRKSRKH